VTMLGALVVFVTCVLVPIAKFSRVPLRRFFSAVKEPFLLAFSTASSETALPKALENMEQMGVPKHIVGFVLPMGYSLNLDGSTLYLALASLFVAQAGNVHMTWPQQILMMLTLMLTSKGVAAVPRASFVILSGTITTFNLPAEGMALLLGVDAILDMSRTSVNVLGNCLASAVVARWEGVQLSEVEGAVEPLGADFT
jgi:proton glutamate symport protein